MSTAVSVAGSGRTDRFWIAQFVRALVALVAAVVVFADPERSARVGQLVFGGFVLVTGLVLVIGAFLLKDGFSRRLIVAQGAFGVVIGVAALALAGDGLGVFLYGVSVWALLTGVAELFIGWRARGHEAGARRWMATGVLTVVLAVVFLLIPPDELLADLVFGVYAAILAVYLGIAVLASRRVPVRTHHGIRTDSDDLHPREHA